MSDLHRVADVIADILSLGGDPLDVARELAKRGMLAYNRTVDVHPHSIQINNYSHQVAETARIWPEMDRMIRESVRRTGGRIIE
jgi:hypothetical protein